MDDNNIFILTQKLGNKGMNKKTYSFYYIDRQISLCNLIMARRR